MGIGLPIILKNTALHRDIDDYHVISDNYFVHLYAEVYDSDGKLEIQDQPLLTMTNNALSRFEISANDEIKKKKPCTRKEHVAIVKHNGWDLSFTFAKVKDDISSMMFWQSVFYHGDNSVLGNENRTNMTDTTKQGAGVTIFNKKNDDNRQEINYTIPTYTIQIDIPHYNKGLEEHIQFHCCQFYNFKQSVEDNASDIIESVQAFSPYVSYQNEGSKNKFLTRIEDSIAKLVQASTSSKRYIINPSKS